ncbi:glycosyltransferase involved in cell wall biosynthesis [Pedobacter sp. W3I1]|uniref:XrtY-associated glycosyltransferase XYAG1 n=1 Tax=Pedobacter sp. W3I1 TaxID=3042291 RepID=UPI0027899BE8|nr:glycosyltransferase [Pedobacter sp. W3I1]MDQ0640921.1 glycosyltransferase involved in cell wall biosynthesis [Pedobacter sp. W3I1]
MKIIHISASYKPAYIYGGPIQSVAKLCEAIAAPSDKREAESGVDLQVLTTTANGASELDVSIIKPILVHGVKVSYFKRWTKDHSHFSPGLLWGLRKEILRCTQDDKNTKIPKLQTPNSKLIIHIHAWWNLVSVLSCLVAKCYGVQVVLSPRGMLTAYSQHNRSSFSKKTLHKLIGKKLLQYCHIHATSEQEKRDILEIITPRSITVIPNLVNLTSEVPSTRYTVSSGNNLEPSSFKLIFLSRIEEKKGLELLFDAISLLDIDWQLTIAGSGKKEYIDSLQVKAQSLKLDHRINWIGQVSDQDKYGLMAKHDLLVLTSFNENFANVVIESLSVGTPVLVSDQVGLSDYVSEKQLGWISHLDIQDIKAQLSNAFSNHEKRQKIQQLAPEIIRKDFGGRLLVNRYLEMYKGLSNEQGV